MEKSVQTAPRFLRWRALVADDRSRVEELLMHGLSARSRSMRFAAPTPKLDSRVLDFMCSADGEQHLARAVLEGDRLAAMARFVRFKHAPRVADLALTVADRWQGRGLGTSLLLDLALAAQAGGVHELSFTVHGDNRAAQRLLRRFGVTLRYSSGLGEAVLPVSQLLAASPGPIERSFPRAA